jgi:hypothetical protein
LGEADGAADGGGVTDGTADGAEVLPPTVLPVFPSVPEAGGTPGARVIVLPLTAMTVPMMVVSI